MPSTYTSVDKANRSSEESSVMRVWARENQRTSSLKARSFHFAFITLWIMWVSLLLQLWGALGCFLLSLPHTQLEDNFPFPTQLKLITVNNTFYSCITKKSITFLYVKACWVNSVSFRMKSLQDTKYSTLGKYVIYSSTIFMCLPHAMFCLALRR